MGLCGFGELPAPRRSAYLLLLPCLAFALQPGSWTSLPWALGPVELPAAVLILQGRPSVEGSSGDACLRLPPTRQQASAEHGWSLRKQGPRVVESPRLLLQKMALEAEPAPNPIPGPREGEEEEEEGLSRDEAWGRNALCRSPPTTRAPLGTHLSAW